MNKILFNRDSIELKEIRELIEKQSHRCLVLWVIDCAPRVISIFEKRYPNDLRPREAFNATILWSKGEIKMPVARRAALDAHKAASDVNDDLAACAAAHAMGHVLGTVHVETHAMGLMMYGLTALVLNAPIKDRQKVIECETQIFYDRLKFWESETDKEERKWASFLLKNDVPNKEKILREKLTTKKANL
ncbi:MAG: hypothetical protein KKH01_05380 [Firmicutes bacterium]|nr:hypothetical protein [Bacillota bacterium]